MKYFPILLLAVLSVSFAEEFQAVREYSSGYNDFTSSVYKELLKSHSGNFVLSPLSVDIVLSLITTGAKEDTAKELISALHLPETNDKIYEIFQSLKNALHKDKTYTLDSSNKVYIKDGFQISNEFKRAAVDVFDADVQNIDFGKTTEAADEINRWVSSRTHGVINQLIDPTALDERVRALLVNAIVFEDYWRNDFKPFNTKLRNFKVNKKETIEVMSMKQMGIFNYYESSELDAKFLEKTYSGDVSMHIVLPNDVEGLSALESQLSNVFTPPEYKSEKVELIIPKFKIETDIDFVAILQAIGVKSAFEDFANFHGIAEDGSSIKISKVVQKASIEIDELKTTAAAASGVMVYPASGDICFPEFKTFHADHPFLFYLRLNKLGSNIFVGRYVS